MVLTAVICLGSTAAAKVPVRTGRLAFEKHPDGSYGLALAPFRQPKPLVLLVKNGDRESRYEAGYATVTREGESVRGTGRITTDHGSAFAFTDVYRPAADLADGEAAFEVSRTVEILKADPDDEGFNTFLGLSCDGLDDLKNADGFAPGAWYGQNANVVKKAFAADLSKTDFFFRETRLPLPLMMLRDRRSGASLTVAALRPTPTTGVDEHTGNWLVNASLQYGSLGVHKRPDGTPTVGFLFPGSEGEVNYIRRKQPWVRRSHPVRPGVVHRYTLLLRLGKSADFAAAMADSWRAVFRRFDPPVADEVDVARVLSAGQELLASYARPYGPGAGVMGLPFKCKLPGGEVDAVSYQMGFVGQQLPAAYQLIRHGLRTGRRDYVEKGSAMVDFWAARSMTPAGVPKTWYDVTPPTFRDYPTYLRVASDGMEGALDAWRVMRDSGQDRPAWLAFCRRYGDWLALVQNADGSFFRAYGFDGKPVHRGKFNTTNPIRFLVMLHAATGDEKYLKAATRAGEWCQQNVTAEFMYVGGTPDNDNTIDKEAGVMALYAYLALHDATGEKRWLNAAVAAAEFAETWLYCWRFPVASRNPGIAKYGPVGQSLIATGHSGADVFLAYGACDFYRLYLFTDDPHFLRIAELLLKNTKLTTDWSGALGYARRGLVEEAGSFALQTYRGVGVWLPWCTVAEIEPIARLQDRFGRVEIRDIERLPLENRNRLNAP